MTLDRLCVADAQTLLEEEPRFSSGNQLNLRLWNAICTNVKQYRIILHKPGLCAHKIGLCYIKQDRVHIK